MGIIAAQSIGEPGTQLTMRTFHIGGAANQEVEESELKSKRAGRVSSRAFAAWSTTKAKTWFSPATANVVVVDPKERELEKYTVPNGATLLVNEDEEVEAGHVLCSWDPHSVPILAEVGGKVRFDGLHRRRIGSHRERSQRPHAPDGHRTQRRSASADHFGRRHRARCLDFYYLPERASIEVRKIQEVSAGTVLAKTPREAGGTQDITGGLPRVTELFEARRPERPVGHRRDRRGSRNHERKEARQAGHHRPRRRRNRSRARHSARKQLLVQGGRTAQSGHGPRPGSAGSARHPPRASGEEAVQQYLLHEIQNVYRAQRVEIDDKHIEIVVSQMLRKVKIEDVGDTDMLPGVVVDKFEFRRVNEELEELRESRRPGRYRIPSGRHRADHHGRGSQRRNRSRGRQARLPSANREQRRPAPSFWESPKRRCKARVLSRRPVSKKPPKC